jgi:glycosyltransferase involved in cell wall biosynthesis
MKVLGKKSLNMSSLDLSKESPRNQVNDLQPEESYGEIVKSSYDVSVVVCAYNPVWRKYKLTLDAILCQKGLKIQIILSDDGSRDTLFEKCRNYFDENHFVDYIMLGDCKNRGTVWNCYKGVKSAEAEYVHVTSPGDYLSEPDILKSWIAYLKKSGRKWSFADAYYYHFDEQGTTIITPEKAHPQIIMPYLKHDDQLARYCYTCLGDNALGAAMLSKKTVQLEYLERIKDRVVYAEDHIWRVMMFDGIVGEYFPKNVVMYEYGTGVSTSGSDIWEQRLSRDWKEANQIMIENYDANDPIQCRMVKVFLSDKIENKWIRKVVAFVKKGHFMIWIKRKFTLRVTAVK